jgi:hypothetical protein
MVLINVVLILCLIWLAESFKLDPATANALIGAPRSPRE